MIPPRTWGCTWTGTSVTWRFASGSTSFDWFVVAQVPSHFPQAVAFHHHSAAVNLVYHLARLAETMVVFPATR